MEVPPRRRFHRLAVEYRQLALDPRGIVERQAPVGALGGQVGPLPGRLPPERLAAEKVGARLLELLVANALDEHAGELLARRLFGLRDVLRRGAGVDDQPPRLAARAADR